MLFFGKGYKPIPRRYRDRVMRAIITHYNDSTAPINVGYLRDVLPKRIDVDNIVSILKSRGLILVGAKINNQDPVITLTEQGKNYMEYEALDKQIENIRYWITTAIAVTALIIAIISLVR